MAETIPQPVGSDTPVAATSSVGALVWPPIETNEARRKGIYCQVIETAEDVQSIVQGFESLPFTPTITRNTGRIFVTQQILKNSAQKIPGLDSLVEGIIPLQDCGQENLADCCLIYLGKNDPSRILTPEQMADELNIANTIFSSPIESDHPHSHDIFDFQLINTEMRNNLEIQAQFLNLYRAFGWDEADVSSLLTNPNNLLLGVFYERQLVSTGMAEQVTVPITRNGQDFDFNMHEITEAATAEAYRGNGLYTAVAKQINTILARTDTNLVYAESNLEAPGVLKAAHRQGRFSVFDTFQEFGFSPKPLRQAVRISAGSTDKRDNNLKNDLLVTFLPRKQLLEKYGNTNN